MIDRIKELMEIEHLSSSQFADEINLQRSSLSHVLSGRNKPSLDFVMKIKQRFKEINLEWIIFGNGEMKIKKPVIPSEDTIHKEIKKKEIVDQQLLNFESQSEQIEIIDEKQTISQSTDSSTLISNKASKVIVFYKNGTFEEFIKG